MIWFWGFAAIHWPLSVLSNPDETASDIIRRVMPVHVVSPDWVLPNGRGEIVTWLIVETKARLAIIGLLWAGIVVAIWRSEREQRTASLKHRLTKKRLLLAGLLVLVCALCVIQIDAFRGRSPTNVGAQASPKKDFVIADSVRTGAENATNSDTILSSRKSQETVEDGNSRLPSGVRIGQFGITLDHMPTKAEEKALQTYSLVTNSSKIYDQLYHLLGLQADQAESLNALLAERKRARDKISALIESKSATLTLPFSPPGSGDPKRTKQVTWYVDDRSGFPDLFGAATAQIDSEIHAQIGDSNFKIFQSYEETVGIRQDFLNEAAVIWSKMAPPLTEDQFSLLVNAIHAANPNYGDAYDVNIPPVLAAAQTFLDPAQLSAVKTSLEEKRFFFVSVGMALNPQ